LILILKGCRCSAQLRQPPFYVAEKKVKQNLTEKPVEKKWLGKEVVDKKEVKPVVETKEPVRNQKKKRKSVVNGRKRLKTDEG
jgi:hypothetical protein